MPGTRIFTKPEVREEMLSLRRQGYSFSAIARRYGADHTTIIFHCQAEKLALTKKQKEIMCDLVREGLSLEEIGRKLEVDSTVIELYCSQHGIAGSSRFPTREALKELELAEGQITAQERRNLLRKINPINKILFKTDSRGVEWRTDEKGEWVCLGRDEYKEYKKNVSIAAMKEKRKSLNKKRLEMLKY
jgi:DNA-binding CsgD family transcriptional regulator